jgi:hypothetical protein
MREIKAGLGLLHNAEEYQCLLHRCGRSKLRRSPESKIVEMSMPSRLYDEYGGTPKSEAEEQVGLAANANLHSTELALAAFRFVTLCGPLPLPQLDPHSHLSLNVKSIS